MSNMSHAHFLLHGHINWKSKAPCQNEPSPAHADVGHGDTEGPERTKHVPVTRERSKKCQGKLENLQQGFASFQGAYAALTNPS